MDSQNSLHLAKMQNSSQEMRDYAFKMEAVKKQLMQPVDKEKKLRESCEGFESIFIQKMWEQMRATIPESGFLKGREEKFWQSMYDQELAKTMASAGGIGLADMMYEQLSRSLRTASKNTADALADRPSGFAAELTPAPLLQATAPQAKNAATHAETPAGQRQPSALAGLYSEAGQPGALPDAFDETYSHDALLKTAAHPAPGVPAVQTSTEDGTDPAIIAVLSELRTAHQAASPAVGQQAPISRIGTLGKPVHKPASGKHTVLPRAMTGPRVPTDQPVHRNLPFAGQETQQAQAHSQIQNAGVAQPSPAGALPGPANSGHNSIGAEALNAFIAQQKNAQLAPGAFVPGAAATDKHKTGG